ncbi:hypothetical protein CFOL_v3_35847 [Cephalotus follicularis]|uniref:Uncharacterized protein n=1 Tax=Cephalotus follicularis TaxID=3775 RepID=A0A1Q3DJR6_CEPFO|nr:hypothetical protein CFOL_v3_35847 [Cephalotus follicularis]
MSETRPVLRRESPWGMPEGEHRQPKAHRCNDRAEDVIQACFEGNPFKTVPGPFKLLDEFFIFFETCLIYSRSYKNNLNNLMT